MSCLEYRDENDPDVSQYTHNRKLELIQVCEQLNCIPSLEFRDITGSRRWGLIHIIYSTKILNYSLLIASCVKETLTWGGCLGLVGSYRSLDFALADWHVFLLCSG